MASFNALFTDVNKPVNRDYEIVVERVYGSALIPVDYQDVNNTFTKINNDISKATRGLLPYTVTPQDFKEANLLLISSLYFKGQWRVSKHIAQYIKHLHVVCVTQFTLHFSILLIRLILIPQHFMMNLVIH